MRVGVVTFPGTLDDFDAARAVCFAGGEYWFFSSGRLLLPATPVFHLKFAWRKGNQFNEILSINLMLPKKTATKALYFLFSFKLIASANFTNFNSFVF